MPNFDLIGDSVSTGILVAATIAGLIQLLRLFVPNIAGKERALSVAIGVISAALCGKMGWLPIDMTISSVASWGVALAMGSGAAYNQLWRMLQKPMESKTTKHLENLLKEAKDAQGNVR